MGLNLKHITATGDVDAVAGKSVLSVVLSPAAAVSTLELRDGGSGGTIRLKLQAAANGTSPVWTSGDDQGVKFYGVLHATLTGASATAAIEYN
jgi:hypothetical protein